MYGDFIILTNVFEVRKGVVESNDANFKGKIAEMKVYDVALNETQIQRLVIQGN